MYTRFWVIIALMMVSLSAIAAETEIMVRAKAVDSKFIGTSVGGIRAIVEDAETGEILDEGWINGGTGDTAVLIENPLKRGERLTDDKTAGFLAKVDIDAPRLLRFKLIGPYGYQQAYQEASLTSWVVPGKDILGDGIIITMTGFIVDAWTRVLENGQVDIYTKASLLCGCPITKDGHWQSDNYEARAILMRDEETIDEVTLDFTGPAGMFSGKTTITEPGHYKAVVYLYDAKTGNVGVDRAMFEIPEAE
ncbi:MULTISPECIES: hypothetical protein [unclassified Methylophaga]|mgnify:FL=1|jgi:hypothetical protein|uniref:hypothetical protein n=1 Tax=unclassified Methylophaga TaxID=2629249 RepID=UPI0025D71750|nr:MULTISPECIES: hypothetical protein [unclassified Methylophaga]|tara:strand:+ start:156 stop:905 length:750 start_codon:yes stop_codon:yes gene_type:complete